LKGYEQSIYALSDCEQAVKLAKEKLEQAYVKLASYQIRSPVRGTIRKIHKGDGESVRALDTVVTVQILKEDDK
jgi:multidrug resistance efflux pump